jgi:hypothetical protein
MSDEKELPVAAQRPVIVDPFNAPPLFVDWVVTAGMFENVVNVTLGSIDHSMKRDDAEMAQIVIATRLRLSREFAIRLHESLGRILGLQAPPDDNAPPAPNPPKNMFN